MYRETGAGTGRALVFGGRGTLGQALVAFLSEQGWLVEAPARAACDIEDEGAVEATLDRVRPEVVFNAAGLTNVDVAEEQPEAAWRANALAPQLLARATAARGVKLVHYSTDFVFDGALERPYDERDPPAPLGAYARSKLEGERRAAAASARVFVLRVGCLYGRGGRNFPSTILDRLRAGQIVRGDRERSGSPTWVREVARASGALAATAHYGLYHCTAAGETTWVDFARFLAGELGLPDDRVVALPSHELPRMKAPRPRRVILDNRMLRERGLDTMGPWQDAARAYVRAETA